MRGVQAETPHDRRQQQNRMRLAPKPDNVLDRLTGHKQFRRAGRLATPIPVHRRHQLAGVPVQRGEGVRTSVAHDQPVAGVRRRQPTVQADEVAAEAEGAGDIESGGAAPRWLRAPRAARRLPHLEPVVPFVRRVHRAHQDVGGRYSINKNHLCQGQEKRTYSNSSWSLRSIIPSAEMELEATDRTGQHTEQKHCQYTIGIVYT